MGEAHTVDIACPAAQKTPPLEDRETFLAAYHQVRAQTEAQAAPLGTEDQTVQSMTEASPTKWHRAHTNWFFETFILTPFAHYTSPLGHLFNSYYEQVARPFPRHQRGLLSRPTCRDITTQRRQIDEAMTRFILRSPQSSWAEAAPRVRLGLHHEQQHQELILTDIKHAMFQNPLKPKVYPGEIAAAPPPKPLSWLEIDGGLYPIGAHGDQFAFDNEGPRHEVHLSPFRLASRLVTNGEYLEFIEDGGYERCELWLADGWTTSRPWQAPLYWRQGQQGWCHYTLHGEAPLDPHGPVCHVSYYEALAYATWAGARLAREAEWEVATQHMTEAHTPAYVPLMTAATPAYGTLWEWTMSPYTPYPGFTPWAPPFGEYNGKFMCNQYVLRGAACTTPAGHSRTTYRNFFFPEARWQFSGIRLAADL